MEKIALEVVCGKLEQRLDEGKHPAQLNNCVRLGGGEFWFGTKPEARSNLINKKVGNRKLRPMAKIAPKDRCGILKQRFDRGKPASGGKVPYSLTIV